ncbi:MAG: ATP-dependent zinc metalloprotease FtsH [Candidatus Enteromonas sp.]|nr:ATP-dependent zinc metalloprotease FtsH [Candidatus Enteromonas sp.]
MNDGKKKRGLFSYILPYLLIGATVGLFVYLIVSNTMNRVETWYQSELDTKLRVDVSENSPSEYEVSTKAVSYSQYANGDYRVYTYNVSEGYKTVTVTGKYLSKNDRSYSFSVRVEAEKWNNDFITTASFEGEEVTATHLSYSSIFATRVRQGAENDTLHPDIYYASVSDAFEVSWWDTWGPTLITTGVTVLLLIFLFSRLNSAVGGGGQNGLMSFNKSPARRADNTKVKFEDVAGCDEEKAEMMELVEYLKDPKKYTKLGARLPKGVLLIGPPGTGKTLLAKAVAGEAGAPFYSISGSDFVEMYVGVGAGRVRDLFKQAKATAPCLIFIDEIDAVGRQRGAGLGGGNDEREQTLNQLLVEMDGFEANSGILVIAATNRDDVLDPALRRAGRFDRTITVSLPDKAGREAIFKVHARNKHVDPSVDFAALAKRTVGFSGADIDSVLNDAAILAVRKNQDTITIADIDEAIDRRIAGPAKSSRGMSEDERRQVAYHEAGHAVIGLNLPFSDKVQKITIIPRGNTGGHVLMTPEDDRFLLTKNQLIARITGLLGGRTSEEIFFQDVSTGASNDIEQATRLARLMVTEFGMSDLGPIQYERDTGSVFLGRDYANTQKNFSTQIAFEIDKEVRRIVEEAHASARKVLEEHKDQVILVAERLLAKETITAEEIEFLCEHGYLPGDPEKPVAA